MSRRISEATFSSLRRGRGSKAQNYADNASTIAPHPHEAGDVALFRWDIRIKSLRDQVAAAQFLLKSLQSQLAEAESEARAGQDNTQQHVEPALSQPSTAPGPTSRSNRRNGSTNDVEPLNSLTDYADTSLQDQETVLPDSNLTFLDNDENDENDAPGETVLDENTSFELPSLEVGNVYPSLEDVKAATRAYAVTQGWTCGVHKRDKTRILLKCRSDASCPFFVRAEVCDNGARIASYRPKHSCTFQIDQSHIPRGHATSLQYMRDQLPTFMNVTSDTSAKEIGDAIFERFGTRVSVKQCQKLRQGPKRNRKPSMGTCGRCGAIGHNVKTCGRVME